VAPSWASPHSSAGSALWLIVFAVFRYASVASITAALSMPLIALGLGEPWPVIAFAAIAAVAVLVLHRQNISRLRAGTETRFRFRRPAAPPSRPVPRS
jgi:acyl phosphate:glycerol-3-phosphate acyltransferase